MNISKHPNNKAKSTPSFMKKKGFSLVEVLITAVIVSVSVLGLVSLQLSELRNTRNALINSQATLLMADITERIRANSTQFNSYAELSPFDVDCKTQTCSLDNLVSFDLFNWQKDLQNILPDGQGTIVDDGDFLTISIRWDENYDGSQGINCPPASAADLDCLQVTLSI